MLLHEFLLRLSIASLLLVAAIYIPNQLLGFYKRKRRKRTHIQCRLCGYRFHKQDPQATCPHCKAIN